ncbi:MAG: metallophosphoesterase family protein, partial [Deltaproteobacteria bacterium]
MSLKKAKLFFIMCGWIIGISGCVAKSDYHSRFQQSSVLAKPTFNLGGLGTQFTFLVASDIHMSGTDTSRLETILDAAKTNNDSFVVFLGDNIDKGEKNDFETLKAKVAQYGFQEKAIFLLGNHDVFYDGWSAFKDLIGPSHYSVTLGNCRFIVLDSADGLIGEEQTEWLEEELKTSGPVHTLVLSHYMPVVPGQRTYLKLANEVESIQLMKMMSRFGVNAWLGGHYHSYIQEKIEGVTYLVAGGGGGRRMEPVKEFFYVRGTVQD